MSDTQTPSRQPLPSTDTYEATGKPRQVAIFSRAADAEKRRENGTSEFAYYSRVSCDNVNDFILRMRVSPNDIRVAIDMDKRGWMMWSHLLTIQEFISWQLEVAMATYGAGVLDSIVPTEDLTGKILKEVLANHPVRVNGSAEAQRLMSLPTDFLLFQPPLLDQPLKAEAQRLMSLPTVSELLREVSEYDGRLCAVVDRDSWKACLIKYPADFSGLHDYAYDVFVSEAGSEWEHVFNGDADPGDSAESKIEELIFLVSAHTILKTD